IVQKKGENPYEYAEAIKVFGSFEDITVESIKPFIVNTLVNGLDAKVKKTIDVILTGMTG
ncbi:Hypothetical predicted protein, partial [Pelobates cultripes]